MTVESDKTISMVSLRHANELYFAKGNDRFFGVKKRRIIRSPHLDCRVMVERHELEFGTELSARSFTRFTVREIGKNYRLGSPKSFDTKSELIEYIGKEVNI